MALASGTSVALPTEEECLGLVLQKGVRFAERLKLLWSSATTASLKHNKEPSGCWPQKLQSSKLYWESLVALGLWGRESRSVLPNAPFTSLLAVEFSSTVIWLLSQSEINSCSISTASESVIVASSLSLVKSSCSSQCSATVTDTCVERRLGALCVTGRAGFTWGASLKVASNKAGQLFTQLGALGEFRNGVERLLSLLVSQ